MNTKPSRSGKKIAQKLHFAVLAADTVLFTLHDGKLYVRLIPVHLPPHFVHLKGLPGGLIRPPETAEQSVVRLLHDKAKISAKHLYIEQLYTFSEIDRDPRGRVVAVAYLALGSWNQLSPHEQQDSPEAFWASVADLPKLAYDHREIIARGLERLKSKIISTTVMSRMMPRAFTLTELEEAYELILNRAVDKRNFRKKILKLGVLKKIAQKRSGQRWRPAQLYAFKSATVKSIDMV